MLPAMWPMITVYREVPVPHRVSLSSTGVENFTKLRKMAFPGRRMQAGISGIRLQ